MCTFAVPKSKQQVKSLRIVVGCIIKQQHKKEKMAMNVCDSDWND